MATSVTDLNPIYKKNSKEYLLTFVDDEGDAIPITDWTVFFTVKKSYADADDDAEISKDVTEHYDAEGGITKIALTPDDTDVTPGKYVYDVQVKKADGSIVTIVIGQVEIKSRVTVRIT